MRNSGLNYGLVGGFVLTMTVVLVVVVALLTGRTGATDSYFATYDNVAGIQAGTKVMYEGFGIGRVAEIVPHREDSRLRFQVWLAIEHGWPIPSDSLATVAASGLLSAVAIDIRGGHQRDLLRPGQEIPAGASSNVFAVMSDVASELSALSRNDIKPLLATLNRHIDTLGTVLESQAPDLLANLLEVSRDLRAKTPMITDSVAGMSRELDDTSKRVNRLLSEGNLTSASHTLANLETMSENVVVLSRELETSRKKVDGVLTSLDGLVAGNRETVDLSLKDLRYTLQAVSRNIDSVTYNLEGTTRNLNEFSREVRENPGIFLSGTKPGQEGPNPQRR